jgi:hypothetical protein
MKPVHKAFKRHKGEVLPETASQEVPGAQNEPEPARASKPATEPWLPENAPDSARRKGLLGISRDKKGYELRWVRYDAVDRRKAQGYVLATPEEFDATADENGMIRRNELVLMVVRKEQYDARRDAVQAQTKLQTKSAKREFLQEREAAGQKLGHSLAIRGENRDEE